MRPVALFKVLCLVTGCLRLTHAEAVGPEIGFGDPNVLKLDWATRGLQAIDFNRDGHMDLAVINNDTSSIDVLLHTDAVSTSDIAGKAVAQDRWKPVFEDAHYLKNSVTVGFPVFDLAVGDFNGDGYGDLAYTARETALTIRLQDPDGDFTEATEFDGFDALGWVETLRSADLDGDGKLELIILSADGFRVMRWRDDGGYSEPELHRLTGQNPFNLIVMDLTGDGLKDILYISSTGVQYFVLREQLSEGGFGPERRFALKQPVRNIRVIDLANAGQAMLFCGVDSRSGGLNFFKLESLQEVAETLGEESFDVQAQVFPMFEKGRENVNYVFEDLNGDGENDLLVSNSGSAEVLLFLRSGTGFESPVAYPAFVGVSSLAGGRFFTKGVRNLIMISAEEKLIGLSEMESSGRLGFPKRILKGSGEPLASSAKDIDGDGLEELVLVVEEEGDFFVLICQPDDRADTESKWSVVARRTLNETKRKPSQIREMNGFQDSSAGFVLFVPRDAPLFLKVGYTDGFEITEVASDSSIRASLLKDLVSAELSIFDIDEDGQNELIVGREGFARVLRFNKEELELVDQLNARTTDDVVAAVIPLSGAQGGQVLAYISSANEFQLLQRDASGVFRFKRSIEAGPIDLIDWYATKEGDVIMGGQSCFWSLAMSEPAWQMLPVGNYETELDDVFFSQVMPVDFDADGIPEIVALDGFNHVAELLNFKDEAWSRFTHWEIFRQNMHYQGRTGANLEPREIVVADFTGDERFDFVFLVHDRVLFYPQE